MTTSAFVQSLSHATMSNSQSPSNYPPGSNSPKPPAGFEQRMLDSFRGGKMPECNPDGTPVSAGVTNGFGNSPSTSSPTDNFVRIQGPPVAVTGDASLSMPFLEQSGQMIFPDCKIGRRRSKCKVLIKFLNLIIGAGAEREAQLLGLRLPKLSFRQQDDLTNAKKFAMETSIKHVHARQAASQKANQQRVEMYRHALSLLSKVYIGNVSAEVNDEMIRSSFAPFGPIKNVNMSVDPISKVHRGYAFIDYEIPEASLLAQQQMNETLLGGKSLKVKPPSNLQQSQPLVERILEEGKEYHRVYVASIHPDLSETDLKSVFEAFGTVKQCQLAKLRINAAGHRGYGYIEYDNEQSVIEAVASMNLFDLGGQFLRVGKAITPPAALTYVVNSTPTTMPTAAAMAAAEITAKILAQEAMQAGRAPIR